MSSQSQKAAGGRLPRAGGAEGELGLKGDRVSAWEDEKVLDVMVVTVPDSECTSSRRTVHRKVVTRVNLTSRACCCNNVCEPIR